MGVTGRTHAELEAIFEEVEAPFAFVDLDAMWSNSEAMLGRAAGKPIRVASKSVRCRALLERTLARDARYRGLMTFTLPETLWLAEAGFENLLLAYPTADTEALGELAHGQPADTGLVGQLHAGVQDRLPAERVTSAGAGHLSS